MVGFIRSSRRLLDPSNALTVLPLALFSLAGLIRVESLPVLLATQPPALIASAIGPSEQTSPLFFVFGVLTAVLTPILEAKDTLAMHPVISPVSRISATICPYVGAKALHAVLYEAALICASVLPHELSMPVLFTVDESALVYGAVRPRLPPEPMMLVLVPVARVGRPIEVRVRALPMHPVVGPTAHIAVAIDVDVPPIPVLLVVAPVALIERAVRQDEPPLAMALLSAPLARVPLVIIVVKDAHFSFLSTEARYFQHFFRGSVVLIIKGALLRNNPIDSCASVIATMSF